MKQSLLMFGVMVGLLSAGCASNRGGAYDQPNSGYNSGTAENPHPNIPPYNSPSYKSGGPERGSGTGGMGGTSTAPGSNQSGRGTSDTDTTPDNHTAPSGPDNGSQAPR